MVEKIRDNSDITENNEKLDLRNDPGYKLLVNNFDKVKILDRNNKPVSKDNLLYFYKKIKEESFNQIEEVLKNSKSNVVDIFGSKEKFEEAVFEEALSFSVGYGRITEDVLSFKYRISGLLEFNYKSKDDFKNAFNNFLIGKNEADFIKNIWGNENISWQQAKKLNNILFSFETGDNYKNSISGKLNKENITILSQLSGNFGDLPDFTDKKYFSYLKNLGLIQNNGKIDVNTAIQIIAFLQGKTDSIKNIDGNELSENNKKEIILLAMKSIGYLEVSQIKTLVDRYNIQYNDLFFLLKTIGLSNLSSLFGKELLLLQDSFKIKLLINNIVEKNIMNVSEPEKEKFIKILNKISNYSEKEFEKNKQEEVKNFLGLFLNANPEEISKELANKLGEHLKIGKNSKEFGNLTEAVDSVFNPQNFEQFLNLLKNKEIKNVPLYIYKKLKDKYKKLPDLGTNDANNIITLIFNSLNEYAKRLLKKKNINILSSDSGFWKVEKDLEKNGFNSYQASIVAYYSANYVVGEGQDKYKGKITQDLFKDKDFQEYLERKLRTNKHKKEKTLNSSTDRLTGNDEISKLLNKLSNIKLSENISFDKKTIEKLKKNQDLMEKINQYQQMGYEGYIHYMEQIESEKKLLKETGTISKEISTNESLLFSNSKGDSNEIQIKSTKINGVHIIESKLPGTNKIIQVESLTKEEGNKSLIKEITGEQFGINISFDNWSADDFSKIINTDITKGILTGEDMENIKKFYQTYAVKLIENNILTKEFLSKNNLKITDIYENFDNFSKALSNWMKNHLSLGGIKPLGNEFYIDSFDHTIKEVINEKYKWNKIKEEILDNQNIGIIGKFKKMFGNFKI